VVSVICFFQFGVKFAVENVTNRRVDVSRQPNGLLFKGHAVPELLDPCKMERYDKPKRQNIATNIRCGTFHKKEDDNIFTVMQVLINETSCTILQYQPGDI